MGFDCSYSSLRLPDVLSEPKQLLEFALPSETEIAQIESLSHTDWFLSAEASDFSNNCIKTFDNIQAELK